MGHMRRMQPYEIVVMPERKAMTAGLSLPGDGRASDNVGMVKVLYINALQVCTETNGDI